MNQVIRKANTCKRLKKEQHNYLEEISILKTRINSQAREKTDLIEEEVKKPEISMSQTEIKM